MRGFATLCAVLIGAFALAGCGGDDAASGDGESTEAVTTMPVETETTPAETTPAETTPAETTTTPAGPRPKTIAIRVVGGVAAGRDRSGPS